MYKPLGYGSMVHRSGYEVMEIGMMGIRRDVVLLLYLVFVFCSGVSEPASTQVLCKTLAGFHTGFFSLGRVGGEGRGGCRCMQKFWTYTCI